MNRQARHVHRPGKNRAPRPGLVMKRKKLSTSQREDLAQGDAGVSGDDNGSAQQLTSLFTRTTRRVDRSTSSVSTHCFTTWPIVTIRTRGRESFWSCSLPSRYSQVVSIFCHSNICFHKRVSLTSSCKISCENFQSVL